MTIVRAQGVNDDPVLVIDTESGLQDSLRQASNGQLKVSSATNLREAATQLAEEKVCAVFVRLSRTETPLQLLQSLPSAPAFFFLCEPEDALRHKINSNNDADSHEYVLLPDPLTTEEWRRVVDLVGAPTANAEEQISGMKAIFQAYNASIPSKLERIAALSSAAASGKDPDVTALENSCHQLCGSAAVYGYPRATILCRNMEERLRQLATASEINPAGLEQELAVFRRDILLAFQKI